MRGQRTAQGPLARRREGRKRPESHQRRARVLNAINVVGTVVFVAVMVLHLTHTPRTLAEERGVVGDWSQEVETRWRALSIDQTLDVGLSGRVEWEVTQGPDQEHVASGRLKALNQGLIVVEDLEPGRYDVHIRPSAGSAYDRYHVSVREHYVSPKDLNVVQLLAIGVGAFWTGAQVVLVLPHYRRFRREYRLWAWVTAPMLSWTAIATWLVL